ncbi:MAG: AAA family ATPase [Pseudomonadota bacterium]
MTEIFVSYKSEDRARAAEVVAALEARGLSVWWDQHIGVGDGWRQMIAERLDAAKCVVVLWTDLSVGAEGRFVQEEAARALRQGTYRPVRLDDVDLPLGFAEVQALPLMGWTGDPRAPAFDGLVDAVEAMLAAEAPQPAPVRPRPRAAIIENAESERRRVTLLTATFDQHDERFGAIDPEALDDWLCDLEARLISQIAGGPARLCQFGMEGFTCAFGVPVREEHEERAAVGAALRIAAALKSGADGIAVGMGIASGIAVTSFDARSGAVRVTGRPTSDAARLSALAGPGDLLVSKQIGKRLTAFYELAAAGPDAMRVESRRRSAVAPDDELADEGVLLIGRDAELAALNVALADSQAGQGAALALVGEAGMGKSRLAREVRRRAHARDMHVTRATCLALDKVRTHAPFADLLADLTGVATHVPDDDAEPGQIDRALSDLVTAWIDGVEPALRCYTPHLLHLMGIASDSHRLPPQAEGNALRRIIGDAVVAALTAAAAVTPLLIVLDDWHLADDASIETLTTLVEMSAACPLVIIVCARTEAAPTWPALPHCRQIVLPPMRADDVAALIGVVAGADDVAPALAERMHAHTDGVPLFVEELTRTLIEQDLAVVAAGRLSAAMDLKALDLPGTIEAVVRTRLDRLAPPLATLIKVAAAIGRRFDRETMIAVYGEDADVMDLLGTAVAEGLVQQTRLVPQPEYRFRSMMTQRVAYESLLVKQRRALHGRIGTALVDRHGDAAPVELLAHHFAEAGDTDRAVPYLLRAGALAAGAAANAAAIGFYRQAVALLEARPDAAVETRLAARVGLGNALILTEGYAGEDLEKIFADTRDLALSAAPGPDLFAGLWFLWRYCYNRAMVEEAGTFAARMMEGAAGGDDRDLSLAAHAATGVVDALAGRPLAAAETLTLGLGFRDEARDRELALRFGMSPAVQSLSFLGLTRLRMGEIRAGKAALLEAVAVARGLAHPGSEALALAYRHGALMMMDDLKGARACNDELLALASAHDFAHWAAHGRMLEGQVRILTGDVATGVTMFRSAVATVADMGVAMSRDREHLVMAWLAFHAGRFDEAKALKSVAEGEMARTGLVHLKGEVDRLAVQLAWHDDAEAAEADCRTVIADTAASGAHFVALKLAIDLAILMRKAGRPGEALTMLLPYWNAIAPEDRAEVPTLARAEILLAKLESEASGTSEKVKVAS